jgi:hypothetical protein
MQIRSDRGWIKAGLAVLVTGVLGGGVMAATGIGPSRGPHKVTADGVTGRGGLPAAAADKPLDLAAAPPAAVDDGPKKSDPVVGDKVMMGNDGGSVTVSDVEDNVSAGRLFGAGQGFKYIAVEVKGCAGPHEKNITFEPAYFLLRLDDGTVHDPGPGVKKPSLEGGTVPTGKCLSGWVTYTVKDGGLPTGVIYDGSVRTTWTVPLPKNAKQTTTTTLRPGATTPAASDADDDPTTSTTKPKSTPTTARSTATTSKSTGTTSKRTASTSKSNGSTSKSTATTGKSSSTSTTNPSPTTSTTGKSASGTTDSASNGKPAGPTTSTTGKHATPVPSPPTTPTTSSSSD